MARVKAAACALEPENHLQDEKRHADPHWQAQRRWRAVDASGWTSTRLEPMQVAGGEAAGSALDVEIGKSNKADASGLHEPCREHSGCMGTGRRDGGSAGRCEWAVQACTGCPQPGNTGVHGLSAFEGCSTLPRDSALGPSPSASEGHCLPARASGCHTPLADVRPASTHSHPIPRPPGSANGVMIALE